MYSQEGLGALPVAVAAGAPVVKAGASVIGAIGGLLGLGGNKKDPGRLAANQQFYSECMGGDQDACTALQYRTGRYGVTRQGRYCNPAAEKDGCGGWATSTAKNDAGAKWDSVVASRAPVAASTGPVTGITTAGVFPMPGAQGGLNPLLVGGALLTLAMLAK